MPAVYSQTREAWLTTHPPGYVEYRDAFAPRGKYGAWLRDKPIVTEVNGNIFMHAGISPAMAPEKIEELNVRVRDEIRRLDRFRRSAGRPEARHPHVRPDGDSAGGLERDHRRQRDDRGRARPKALNPIAAS